MEDPAKISSSLAPTQPTSIPEPPLPPPPPPPPTEQPNEPLLVFKKSEGGQGSKPKKPFLIGGAILVFLLFSVALATYLGQKGRFGATPTPSRSVAPGPTATSTPGSLSACFNVQVAVAGGGSLDSLKIGDSLTFVVSFGGTAENAGLVIKKEGIKVKTLTAGSTQTNSWTSPAYIIESLGSYEVSAYVKVNGVWK